MTTNFHLAQVNIARAKAALDSPVMQGFVDQLDHINKLAEASPGFVWRLQTEQGDATAVRISDDDDLTIVNLSVWESFDSLKNYVYSGEHLGVLKNKKNWFEKPTSPTLALWWVPAGTTPSIEAAQHALTFIQENGSTPEAFTFSRPFPAPDQNKI